MTRALVCGGRDFDDYGFVREVLDYYAPTVVIHGAARGADSLAHRWARNTYTPVESYPADWKRDGKAAGPIRNAKMLAEGKPDLVIAFPGGNGTAHMVKIAKAKGVQVIQPSRGGFVFLPLSSDPSA
jgi:hypothetical protein